MEWKDKICIFKQIGVRGIQGNFFQGLKKQAMLHHFFGRRENDQGCFL